MNNPRAVRPSLSEVERSPIQQALDNYTQMERMLLTERERNRELLIQNNSLMSEVNMLKEQWDVADRDRIRLQAVSSTLIGQLSAINSVIADSMRLAIKHGVEAVETAKTTAERQDEDDLDQDAREAQEIIQRLPVSQPPVPRITSPAAPQGRSGPPSDAVDWIRPPRG